MLNRLETIIKEAGKKLAVFHKEADKGVRHKGSVDLVTKYDLLIEKELTIALNKAFPDYTVIGEEGADSSIHKQGKVIYLDPIDGTTNFVHKLPFCAISCGMYEDGEPICACVDAPLLRETYSAEKGRGAFLNGERISVSKTVNPVEALVCTGFPYDRSKVSKIIPVLEHLLSFSRDIRRTGSASIDLCYTARGVFDVYYELDLKPWDMAAGILIVKEAGGEVTDLREQMHDLSTRLVVATNGRLHKTYLQEIKKVYEE